MTVEYILTALVVVAMPGAGVLHCMSAGLGQGFKAAIASVIGGTIGILPAAFASIVGLATLLQASAIAFAVLKLAGAAYLVFMGWQTLRNPALLTLRESAPRKLRSVAASAFLVGALNPKLSLFFLAFLPQFIDPADPNATATLVELAAVFMALTLVVFAGYAACAALARDYVLNRPAIMAWIRRSFAAAFGALGAKLALS